MLKGLDILSYSVGETARGVVSGVTDYGAFVRLDDGRCGMIHISKLSNEFVSNIHNFIKIGDLVNATVIADNDGKLALSLVGDKKAGNRDRCDFESLLSSFKTASADRLTGKNLRDKKRRR